MDSFTGIGTKAQAWAVTFLPNIREVWHALVASQGQSLKKEQRTIKFLFAASK